MEEAALLMMDISNCEALPRTITFPCKNLQKMGHPPGAAGNVQPKIGVGSPQSIAHGPPHFADAVSCDNFDVQPRSSMLHEHKRILHASARLRSCYGFTRQVSVVRNTNRDSDWPDGGRPSSGNPHSAFYHEIRCPEYPTLNSRYRKLGR
jgi:hypothetical protein